MLQPVMNTYWHLQSAPKNQIRGETGPRGLEVLCEMAWMACFTPGGRITPTHLVLKDWSNLCARSIRQAKTGQSGVPEAGMPLHLLQSKGEAHCSLSEVEETLPPQLKRGAFA